MQRPAKTNPLERAAVSRKGSNGKINPTIALPRRELFILFLWVVLP
jgi:hypothetical protein